MIPQNLSIFLEKMNNEIITFHKAEDNFFSLVSFSRKDYGNLIAYTTGVQASGLNPAIVNKIEEQFEKNITVCHSFYTQNKLPWALVLPDYLYTQSIDHLLQKHELELTGLGVGMIALITEIVFPEFHTPLIIKKITKDLKNWSIPLIHGFESTPEVTGVYIQRHELACQSDANLYHFSGFIDNIAVCSLSLSLCDDYARIDDVATVPVFQKKGYATQLIYTALNYAKQLNVTRCFLEASKSGLGLYKKMGFTELFINRYYELSLKLSTKSVDNLCETG